MRSILFAAAAIVALTAVPASANLLTNGDFSAGNTGFTTGYTIVPANGSISTVPPQAGLTTNPATGFANGYNSYTDHTADAAGLMLLIDGQTTTIAWSETVSLSANTQYTFSFWATSADGTAPATLQVMLNSVAYGSSNPLTTVGQWVQYTDSFTTGADGNTTLALVDLVSDAFGNDFTLDDLDLEAVQTVPSGTPEPVTLSLFGAGLGGLSMMRKRKGKRA